MKLTKHPLGELEESNEICAARKSRFAASIALLAGLGATGVLGVLRQALWIDLPYDAVALCFTLGISAGLLTAAMVKRRALRQLRRVEEAPEGEGPPTELRSRLRVVERAEAVERQSYALPLATALAYSPALIVVALSFAGGPNLEHLGKALSAAFSFGWPLLFILFGTAYLQMRRLTGRDRKRASVWTASAGIPFLSASVAGAAIGVFHGFPALPSIFFSGSAAAAISVPAFWWAMRRLMRERDRLARNALPSRFDDSDATRRLLASTVEWRDGPSAIRADALRGLATRLDFAELRACLDRALGEGDPLLTQAALRISIEKHCPVTLARLLELAKSTDDATLSLLPAILSRHRDAQIEAVLREMLKPSLPRACAAAVEALGLVGSIDAVEPLRRTAESAGPGRLRAMCTEAIERIHIRRKGGHGQLALVDGADDDGRLSYPEEAGALGIAAAKNE
jgi:hypothetical protein